MVANWIWCLWEVTISGCTKLQWDNQLIQAWVSSLPRPGCVGVRSVGLSLCAGPSGGGLPLYHELPGPSWDNVSCFLGQMSLGARVFKTETACLKPGLSSNSAFLLCLNMSPFRGSCSIHVHFRPFRDGPRTQRGPRGPDSYPPCRDTRGLRSPTGSIVT